MDTNLWRISRHDDLDGIGGEKADGRWHTAAKGKRIVYLSEHPAVALVEILANLKGNPRLFPNAYRMMKLGVHPNVWSAAEHVDPSSISPQHEPGAPHLASEMWVSRAPAAPRPNTPIPPDWRDDLDHTRRIGDAWLSARTSALLRVPSAPSPESSNYLLNPLHPDARTLTIAWTRWVTYDKRLFHLHEQSSP